MQFGPLAGLPIAEQFAAAYKRLLLRSSIQGHNANCTKQDDTDIQEVIGDTYKAENSTESNVTINDAGIIRKYKLQGTNQKLKTKMIMMIIVMHSAFPHSDAPSFEMAAIPSMAGYVAQMVQKKTTSAGHEAVGSRQHKSESAFLTFQRREFVQASRECHRSMH